MKVMATSLIVFTLSMFVMSLYGQQVQDLSPYQPAPPFPQGARCTKATDCGHSGCCLHGLCSTTGSTADKCYAKVTGNGRIRPTGIWNQTDICPCEYTYYCLVVDSSNVDSRYGPIGICMPIMG
ncbi:unnamed protein product [Lymnaea stagnalis]|uniref:Uncharacterized protein n=1 Tax=Lymnaea stagnalis TaxID=6523 RepID=A0AAV2HAY5_LYMST